MYEAGIADQVEVIHHETSPTNRNDEIFALNPLGKVPVLICDDGQVIFGSSVICLHINQSHSKLALIPEDNSEKIKALQLEALADVI